MTGLALPEIESRDFSVVQHMAWSLYRLCYPDFWLQLIVISKIFLPMLFGSWPPALKNWTHIIIIIIIIIKNKVFFNAINKSGWKKAKHQLKSVMS